VILDFLGDADCHFLDCKQPISSEAKASRGLKPALQAFSAVLVTAGSSLRRITA
jgi:hypothetical protein